MSLFVPLAFWYVQDFLQVLFGSWTIAPEVFLISMMTLGLSDDRSFHPYVWGCFLGGLMWDLRWTGIPGFTGALYSFLFAFIRITWFATPKEGRLPAFFLVMVSAGVLVSSGVRGLFFYSASRFSPGAFAAFSAMDLVCVIAAWLCYSRFYRSQDV